MKRQIAEFPPRARFRARQKDRNRRLFFESLEDWLLLAAGGAATGLPGAIVLGRTLATSSQIDSGPHAYAMLDARAVSASTPAAMLKPGNVSDPGLLASTIDPDTNDPYVQEHARHRGPCLS